MWSSCKQFKCALVLLFFSQILGSVLCESAESGKQAKTQFDQQRRLVAHTALASRTNVGQLVAILRAKPRDQNNVTTKRANNTTSLQAVSTETTSSKVDLKRAAKQSNERKQTKAALNKRQTYGELGDQTQPSTATSGRIGDPWFLDQAPLPLQPYRFAYNVKGPNGLTEQYRQEAGDGKYLTGSYGYVLPDGIYRHVDYIADDRGFRAFIRTSEPGTANQNPADVVINSTPWSYSPGVSYAQDVGGGNYVPSPLLSPGSLSSLSAVEKNNLTEWNNLARQSDELRSQRRPPGSIVGTPLSPAGRNFSSFSYQPTPWSQGQPKAPNKQHFDSAQRSLASINQQSEGNNWQQQQQLQLQDTQGAAGLGWPNSSWNEMSGGKSAQSVGSWQRSGLPGSRAGQLPLERISSPSWKLPKVGHNFGLSEPALQTPITVARHAPWSLSRSGPGVLAYDRQFANQVQPNGHTRAYDNEHVLHAGVQLAAVERAHNLALLGQLKTIGRLGEPAPNLTGNSNFRLSEGNHHQQQHRDYQSSRHFSDGLTKVSVVKEHQSGSSSGFGRQQTLAEDGQKGGGQPNVVTEGAGYKPATVELLSAPPMLPPEPHFERTPGAHSVKGGASQQFNSEAASSRLRAPYIQQQQQQQHHQHPQPDEEYNSAEQQQQQDQQQILQKNLSSGDVNWQASLEPHEPRSPGSPLPVSTLAGEQQQPSSSTKAATTASTTVARQDVFGDERAASKLPETKADTKQSQVVRSVRMPEDYRTSILMNDLRSMQNTLGLPQPPRMTAYSSTDSGGNSVSRSQLADHSLDSRMHRVNTLVGSRSGHSLQTTVAGESDSAIGLHAATNKQSDGLLAWREARSLEPASTNRNGTSTTATSSESRVAPKQQKQTHQLQQLMGPLSPNEQLNTKPLSASEQAFEAQRLNKSRSNFLRQADKLSELEKFQRRLKSQQLLLEQLKSDSNQQVTPQRQASANSLDKSAHRPAQSTNGANSYVNYDEPPESTQHRGQAVRNTMKGLAQEVARLRRQNEASEMNRTSELARQINSWPSLLELRNETSRSTSNITSKDKAVGRQHSFVEQPVRQALNHTGSHSSSSSTTTNASTNPIKTTTTTSKPKLPNTINLDFINSVTALSMDQLNPFALSSATSAQGRRLGHSSASANSINNLHRLSPHKLELANTSNNQQQQQQQTSFAPISQFFHNANELVDSIGEKAARLEGDSRAQQLVQSGSGPFEVPANHQPSGYSLPDLQLQENNNPLAAKFIIGPTTSITGGLYEAANSHHKSVAAISPAMRRGMAAVDKPHESLVGVTSAAQPLDRKTLKREYKDINSAHRDGFQIRDREPRQDNHRFF